MADALRDAMVDAEHDILPVAAAHITVVGLRERGAESHAAARIWQEDRVACGGQQLHPAH
jgi:hypothetical protein